MNIKDFKWTEKRFGTRFANILKKLGGLSKDGTDGSIEYKDDEGNVTKLVTDSNFSSLLAKNGLIEVKWQELKDKRDNGQLIPGSLYRITDYQCTTTQENTQSAGHQFDIVLLALSEDKLAEEGWAMEHPSDIWTITFSNDATIDCYVYYDAKYIFLVRCDNLKGARLTISSSDLTYNEDGTATAPFPSVILVNNLPYNYFQNSNLSAWKVWYCLDNDKSRFAWAQKSKIMYKATPFDDAFEVYVSNNTRIYDSKTYYACLEKTDNQDVNLYVLNKDVNVNTEFYTFGGPSGREKPFVAIGVTIEPEGTGVIYRLIDEFNNDIKYDFKNIQFKRKLTDGQYDATNGTETWCYTLNIWYNNMCQDASIVGNTLLNDEGYISGVYDNIFGYATARDLQIEGVDTFAFALGDNVVLTFVDDAYYGIFSNTIGNSFFSNTIGNLFFSNMIGNSFFSNIIGHDFYYNTIGNYFYNKTISDTHFKNYGNNGVELATKDDIGDIETALNNI